MIRLIRGNLRRSFCEIEYREVLKKNFYYIDTSLSAKKIQDQGIEGEGEFVYNCLLRSERKLKITEVFTVH